MLDVEFSHLALKQGDAVKSALDVGMVVFFSGKAETPSCSFYSFDEVGFGEAGEVGCLVEMVGDGEGVDGVAA